MPLPTDPLLASQWHLNQTVFGLLDLNVLGVWDTVEGPEYTGAGTRSLVIDDGFDYNHQDFDNYDQNLDFDFEFDTLDPFGLATEAHGTAVAGIIGAAADGTGAVGVAFDTSMVGYRVAGLIGDAWLQDIRDAIAFGATNAQADVANISQGIANDLTSEFGVGYLAVRFDEIEASIATAVDTGRGGLGMTIVKSAGNSRAENYDVNADDWSNDTRQVVVGAVDQNGFVSSFSSYGAALLVSAFGTPGEVVTTDRTGAAGFNATDFTSTFNGTNAAAAMVTGVVSLMYDANAGLGWRDVQSILAVSARQVGSEVGAGIAGSERYAWNFNAAGTWNGGGQHFSNDYGYGLVDALAAVRLAETWLLTGTAAAVTSNQFSNTIDVLNVSTVIPDGNATGLSFVGNATFDDIVDRVTVEMTFSTTFTGDVEVYLTSPDGTISQLIDNAGGGNDFNGTWTFESQAFRGERAAGNWTVRVVDTFGGDTLNVSDIVIRTFGSNSNDDRYIFTNEYSDYVGVSGHTNFVFDSNFGTDTINAAAVSSASVIRLDGVGGTIDGIGILFEDMEHAIGGDAGDTLVGNIQSNQLFGMRGSDSLFGGANTDFLYGGTNNDLLDGGDGIDNLFGGDGDDTYVTDGGDVITEAVGAGTELVQSSASYTLAANLENLTLTGAAALNGTGNTLANLITGNAGNNLLDGGTGADTLDGGDGDDTYVTDGGDVITEGLNAGIDLVRSSVSYTLAANLENLTLTGAAVINGTGNGLANRLAGNAGNNVLKGGGGADTMLGYSGNDRYFVDNALDRAFEAVGGGLDRVLSSVNFTLAARQEVESLTTTNAAGVGAINLKGNAFNQTIAGNGGVNVLNGGLGNDTLYGFGGADTFVFNTALNVATNRDAIMGYNSAADTIQLENTGVGLFNTLALGVLNALFFKANATGTAKDADDRIIYNTVTGALFYDSNGIVAGGATQFATLSTHPVINAADFEVV